MTPEDRKTIIDKLECVKQMRIEDDAHVPLNEAFALLRAEPKKQEPVAWMSNKGKVVSASGKLRMEEAEHPIGIHYDIPLYTHPQ